MCSCSFKAYSNFELKVIENTLNGWEFAVCRKPGQTFFKALVIKGESNYCSLP